MKQNSDKAEKRTQSSEQTAQVRIIMRLISLNNKKFEAPASRRYVGGTSAVRRRCRRAPRLPDVQVIKEGGLH